MRDFLPADVRKREYVINIIKEVYESYGFEPLETPSVENLETLTGKYGEEGNQLIYKILKRGEKLEQELGEGKIKSENELSDLALRYDLTVPLARVVANYKNELPKFFKRYQIQPVWRADRPARGRYREFYQCDVDAIGSSSMVVEAELISAVSEILQRLGFEDFVIKLNHRNFLTGILEAGGLPINFHVDALVALDKLDKIGTEGVFNELINKGIPEEVSEGLIQMFRTLSQATIIDDALQKIDPNEMQDKKDRFQYLKNLYKQNLEGSRKYFIGLQDAQQSIDEMLLIGDFITTIDVFSHLKLDPSLARGLSYYSGAIFEVILKKGDFHGSIAGGGRYDGLIGMFGKEQIPACGFSLGLERILVVMDERGMFPPELETNAADVMITIWNEDSIGESLKLANDLRQQGLRVLVYPEADKPGKQFKYADSINIPFVCILGETELAENKVALKNMKSGEQEKVSREEIAGKIRG